MRKLNDWCPVERIDPQAITLTDLERFFDHLLDRYAVSTTRLTATTIKAVYRYAQGRGLIPTNPCLDLILPIEPDTEPRVFTSDELRSILAAVRDPRENLIIHLLAYAGLRRQECREARRDDVDLQRATMRVLGKGKKWRVIPVHPCLAGAIDLMERVRFDPFGGSPYAVPNLLYADQPISHSHWSQVLDPIARVCRRPDQPGTAQEPARRPSSLTRTLGSREKPSHGLLGVQAACMHLACIAGVSGGAIPRVPHDPSHRIGT
jgi:integrase